MKSLYLNASAQIYFKEVTLYIFVKQMCKSSKNCQIPFGSMEMYINEWQKKVMTMREQCKQCSYNYSTGT
jgi:hypothetical protein